MIAKGKKVFRALKREAKVALCCLFVDEQNVSQQMMKEMAAHEGFKKGSTHIYTL
jgi:hypothetical protein